MCALMKRLLILLLIALVPVGCGQSGPAESSPTKADSEAPLSTVNGSLVGQNVYDKACSTCHQEGVNGAPKTGDAAAWEGRSWLWEAVLFEHARCGYNDMPAKGGDEELDELMVTKAAEYMMQLTYPDVPTG
jgi:cytochrome c5